MKTLYMTDLDGTLLRSDKTVSPCTIDILNRLAASGCLFSVCTARGLHGLDLLPLGEVNFTAPMVLMNGVLLYDPQKRRLIDRLTMPPCVVERVLAACRRQGKEPFIYRPMGERLLTEYSRVNTAGEQAFLDLRLNRFPDEFRRVDSLDPAKEAVYFTMQDTHERLSAIRQELQETLPEVSSALYKDNYLENNWFLEIFDHRAGKDNGVKRVQALTGAERLVVFGDNNNDLPMLRVADLACVVNNGVDAAKEAADVLIGGNDEDGVALFMEDEWKKGEGR